jgi:hypothetical protein
MNLFDVLSNGERIIVFSVEQDRCIYTWNQSLTLQCWGAFIVKYDDPFGCVAGSWEEQDCLTLSKEPANFEEAKKAAEKWYYDQCE